MKITENQRHDITAGRAVLDELVEGFDRGHLSDEDCAALDMYNRALDAIMARTVYVAAAVGSTGAFAWRETRAEAETALASIAAPDDDTCIRAIELPTGPIDVTGWLDANPELWEPKRGERAPRSDAEVAAGPASACPYCAPDEACALHGVKLDGEHAFRYVVTVSTDTREHADAVMTERIGCDEDYGFPYTIDHASAPASSAARELALDEAWRILNGAGREDLADVLAGYEPVRGEPGSRYEQERASAAGQAIELVEAQLAAARGAIDTARDVLSTARTPAARAVDVELLREQIAWLEERSDAAAVAEDHRSVERAQGLIALCDSLLDAVGVEAPNREED